MDWQAGQVRRHTYPRLKCRLISETRWKQVGALIAISIGITTSASLSDISAARSNGTACGSNNSYPLHLTEGISPSDNLDALGRDPCQYVDLDCDGIPENPIFFTLASGSPSLGYFGFSSADILVSGIDYAPMVWATSSSLGLMSADQIDALCIRENGNGRFDSGDQVIYSLASGSPSLTTYTLSAADLLRPAPTRNGIRPSIMGLELTDDVDALTCAMELRFSDLFLPLVLRNY